MSNYTGDGTRYTQYPFPLANGGTAYVHLPDGVTQSDIDRLAQLLRSLVIEDETPEGGSDAG